jgi:hypothetical protein
MTLQQVGFRVLLEWPSVRRLDDPYHYDTFEWLFRASMAMTGSAIAIVAVVAWLPVLVLKNAPAWRWFFFALAMPLSLLALLFLRDSARWPGIILTLSSATTYFAVAAAGMLLLLAGATLADVCRRRSLPWTHWLGIAVFVLQAGLIGAKAFVEPVASKVGT